MRRKHEAFLFVFVLNLLLSIIAYSEAVCGWSNGGYSDTPANPKYGTHDWIAQHALDWLPTEEKRFILDNLAGYLYGTELPDNGGAPDGIGDTAKHHVYYHADGSLQDDASAVRAQEEYDSAVSLYTVSDYVNSAKMLGVMAHYVTDVAVFGHVMGSNTDWGTETHHSDYETYVNERTSNYIAEFNSFLVFDGTLNVISAYNATLKLANNTTFDSAGTSSCLWMDQNYDWNNPTFRNRSGESLNLAVNLLTDILHTFYLKVIVPEFPVHTILPLFLVLTVFIIICMKKKSEQCDFSIHRVLSIFRSSNLRRV